MSHEEFVIASDFFSTQLPSWVWGLLLGAVTLPIALYFWRQRKKRLDAEAALERQRELAARAESDLANWVHSNPCQLESLIDQIEALSSWGGYPRIRPFKYLSDRISSSGVMGIDPNYLNDSHPLKDQVKRVQDYPKNYEVLQNQLKLNYIESELNQNTEFFDTIEKLPLTPMQRRAVIVHEENNLVIAGAGSGKTSVIAARAFYLIQRQLAKPHEILILAYNKNAATELEQRISYRIGPEVSIKTFHKLGSDIISESRGVKPSVANSEEDELGKKLSIQRLLSNASRDKAFAGKLLNFFTNYLVPYQDITSFTNEQGYLEYLAKNELRSLNGEKVKSYGELLIANYLYLNGVDYKYEAKYEYETATPYKRTYKPDFWLPKCGIYIEYLALDRKGETPPFILQKKYTDELKWKQELHRKKKTVMAEIRCYHTMEGNLEVELQKVLDKHGVTLNPIPKKEVFSKLKEFGEITRFANLLGTFLSHYKSNKWTINSLEQKARQAASPDRNLAFLEIFNEIHAAYERALIEQDAIDFDDMIAKAVDYIEQGEFRSSYKHILVDEFQDISRGRAKLLKALRQSSGDTTLFCVGDDWQSIYRFAGSDVSLMGEFDKNFGNSEMTKLDKSFRYNDKIAEISGAFIQKNPAQISKDISTIMHSEDPQVFFLNGEKTELQYSREALNHILETSGKKASVLLLGRYNHTVPDEMLQKIRREFGGLDINFKTVHKSKGLEFDYVILLGLNSSTYGFPSMRVDDPILNLVLPVAEIFEHADERRLFYVAITRARNSVYLINGVPYRSKNKKTLPPSSFLTEVMSCGALVLPLCEDTVRIRTCPKCKMGVLVGRRGPSGDFYGCSLIYCDHTENKKRD
jgi:DNA helicase-4